MALSLVSNLVGHEREWYRLSHGVVIVLSHAISIRIAYIQGCGTVSHGFISMSAFIFESHTAL